jgi:hypothetical protein
MHKVQPWGTAMEMYVTSLWYDEEESGLDAKDFIDAANEWEGKQLEWCEFPTLTGKQSIFIREAPAK